MNEHYYSEEQKSEFNPKKIITRLRDKELEFWTGAGVFSGKKIDKGSELLANKCTIKENWKVLDLGCGYGPIGISIAKAHPSTEVVLTDINKRAVNLSRMNKRLNKVSNISIVQGEMYDKVKGKFDTILLNPPQTAGKDVCFKMIELAKNYLNKDGLLQIVARHQKGGKSLAAKMESVFGNVKDTSKKSGYRIYVSKN